MTRSIKVLVTIMVVVIGLLAGVAGFYIAKTNSLQKEIAKKSDCAALDSEATNEAATEEPVEIDTSITPSASPSATVTASASASPTATSTAAATTTSGEKYTVKSGDTMFSIAQQYKVNWLDLAKANGLDETTANSIKIGQSLIIPAK